MVYLITSNKNLGFALLVKSSMKELVEERLTLGEDESIVAAFTDAEIQTLCSAEFAVVSGR